MASFFAFKNNAFASEVASPTAALPEDYAHEFAPRVRESDCCCVIRHAYLSKHPSKPRRCRSKRREWNPADPSRAKETCHSHRGSELAAKAWSASNG